jgi:hypothetical protein
MPARAGFCSTVTVIVCFPERRGSHIELLGPPNVAELIFPAPGFQIAPETRNAACDHILVKERKVRGASSERSVAPGESLR